MDKRRSSGETATAPLRLLFPSAKIHKKPIDFPNLTRYNYSYKIQVMQSIPPTRDLWRELIYTAGTLPLQQAKIHILEE